MLRKNLSLFTLSEQVSLSFVIGVSVSCFAAYVFYMLGYRFLTPFFLSGLSLLGIRYLSLIKRTQVKFDSVLGILIFAGVVGQCFLTIPSGWLNQGHMRFYGVNAHDGLWHVSLMEMLLRNSKPLVPTYADAPLKGYHFLLDLFASELMRMFSFSSLDLYFRFIPVVFSLLLGLLSYQFIRRIDGSRIQGLFGVFLIYFSGSMGFLIGTNPPDRITTEAVFWVQQSISTFLNVPFGVSLVILLSFLILFSVWNQQKDLSTIFLCLVLLGGVLGGIKAYGGILLLVSLGLTSLVALRKGQIKLVWLTGAILVTMGLILFPQINWEQKNFIWHPGWFLRTMMEMPDRVHWVGWEMKRLGYSESRAYLPLMLLWILALIIFVLGNVHIRMLGVISLLQGMRKSTQHHALNSVVFFISLGGFAISMLFVQATPAWNSIQFFYYTLFFMGLYTSLTVGSLWQSTRVVRKGLVIALLVAVLPTSVTTLLEYRRQLGSPDVFQVSQEEIEALTHLKQLSQSRILSSYADNPYVSAFVGKPVFYEDRIQAQLLGLPTETREEIHKRIYCMGDAESEVIPVLEKHLISHIYVAKTPTTECLAPQLRDMPRLRVEFENHAAVIYSVR